LLFASASAIAGESGGFRLLRGLFVRPSIKLPCGIDDGGRVWALWLARNALGSAASAEAMGRIDHVCN